MKTKYKYSNLIIGLLLLTATLLSNRSYGQPDYDFRDPVLLSGTDREVGAIYLFSNVKTGVDARVTITEISPGIVVTELDGASGYPEALQPTLVAAPFSNGYLEMHLEFLHAGTSTLFPQTEVPVTCIDVDGWTDHDGLGNPLYEFDQVDLGGGYVDYQLTGGELSVTQDGNWFNGKNTGGIDYPGRDTAARQVMYTVVNGNISSCVIRVGVDNPSTTSGNRLRSVYFKKFVYPNSILSKSQLLSFRGFERNDQVELQWKLALENNLKSIIVERSISGGSFTNIHETSPGGKNPQQYYTYFDNGAPGKVSYRLKLVTVNGKVSYSSILVFDSAVSETAFKIFPSVITSSATVHVRSAEQTPAIFQLVDYSGRVILQHRVYLQQGNNNIAVNDLANVNKGNYIALVKFNNKVYSQKIFKP